jgi:pimeloyl-ACP methyl ester carboxylesterase
VPKREATEPTRLSADSHGTGRTVVLLHGQPGGRHDWDHVVASLDGRLRLLIPDRLGYGATGGRAGGFADNAAAVVDLLDAQGVDSAIVAGHSWGGGVALEVALGHPGRVAALVLVAAVGGPGSVATVDRVLGAPVVGDLLSLGGLVALGLRPLRRLLAPWGAPVDRSAVEPGPADRWWASWRSFMTEQRALLKELPAISARLPMVRVPAVVVIGEGDRIVRPSSQEALAAVLSGSEVVRVARAGHLLPRESPDAVAGAIVRASDLCAPSADEERASPGD